MTTTRTELSQAAKLSDETGPPQFSAANVSFPTLSYKIPHARLTAAQTIVRRLPAGTMLAPESLSVILPLISGKLRLTNFRNFDAPLQFVVDGHPAQGAALEKAFEYVSGDGNSADRLAAFEQVISWGPDYVVLDSATLDQRDAMVALTNAGYRELLPAVPLYRVFLRPVR